MPESERSLSPLRTHGSRCLRALACGLALLAGCTDGNAPFEPGANGQFALGVLPQFSLQGGPYSETLPITRIRLVGHDSITGAVLGDTVADGLDPSLSSWSIELALRVPETGQPAIVIVSIELIHVESNGAESVQWSGLTNPMRVASGQVMPPQTSIRVYPGPLTNLGVRSITIVNAPDALVEGDSTLLASEAVIDGDEAPAVFWSTLDPDVATAGPEGRVRTLRDGTARIVASAGPRADTVSIPVLQRPARVAVTPDTAVADALGAEVEFSAVAFDARDAVIAGADIDWSVSGAAEHLGGGRMRALDNGVAHITAGVGAGIAGTAVLVVGQTVAHLEVDRPRLEFDGLAQTTALAVIARDRNGNIIPDAAIDWFSTDPAVARVDGAGVVTSTGLGDAAIVVSSGDVVMEIPVAVRHVPGSIRITPASLAFDALGGVLDAEATVIATDGTSLELPVTWSSSAPAVVTVDGGSVTAVGNGEAVVTAQHGSLSATIDVTVAQAIARITIDPADGVVPVTASVSMTAAAADGNGHPVATQFLWSSADQTVARVDEDGTVHGIGPGSTVITASAGGVAAAAAVIVTAPNLVARTLHVSPDPVPEDGQLDAVLTVLNDGDGDAADASWRLRLAATPGGAVLAEASAAVPALEPGASVSVPLTLVLGGDVVWPTTIFAEAVIDADGALVEASTADNRIVSDAIGVLLHAAAVEIGSGDIVLPSIGATTTLGAAVRDRHGRTLDRAVDWTSTDAGIASVDSTGLVMAHAPGEAMIIATSGTAADTIRVRVAAPDLTIERVSTGDGAWAAGTTRSVGVRVRNTGDGAAPATSLRIRIHAGDVGHHDVVVPIPTLAANVSHEQSADVMLPASTPWPSAVELELTIDPAATITESDESNNTATSGSVAVRFPVAALEDVPTDLTLTAIGATAGISPTARDQHGRGLADRAVTYTSADARIATVSAEGVITAEAPGTTSVTVQAEEVTVTVPVVVTQVATVLTIVDAPATLVAGASFELVAAAQDANGIGIADAAVAWTSSNAAVLQVAGAVATALVPGTATLEVTLGALSAQAVIQVVPGAPAGIAVIDGDEQAGRVAETLPQPLTVEVRDANGFAVPGVLLEWVIDADASEGIGMLSQATTTTDENGRAAVSWTLGHRAGQHMSVARLTGVDVSATFRANARAGAPHRGLKRRGGGQSDLTVSLELTDELELEVVDEFGNPVPAAAVRWTVQEGNGRFGETTTQNSVTDALGLSSIQWTVGTLAGRTSVLAQILDEDGVTVLGSAEYVNHTKPGPLAKLNLQPKSITLTVLEGDTIFTVDPRDEFDNVVPGVVFAWRSDKPEVLIADSAGPGKGRGVSKTNGVATVTVEGAADGVNMNEQAIVTVEQEAVAGITLTQSGDVLGETATVSLQLDGTIELTASGLDANAKTITQFRWSVVDGGGTGDITFDGPANADQQPTVTIRGAAVGELSLQVSDPKRSTVRIIRVNVLAP